MNQQSFRMQIKKDPDARDGLEIREIGRDKLEIRIGEGIDFKDKSAVELFEEKMNAVRFMHGKEEEAPFNHKDPLHRVELERLGDSIIRGKDRYNFTLHSH